MSLDNMHVGIATMLLGGTLWLWWQRLSENKKPSASANGLPISFQQWIVDNGDKLKPPVGAFPVYKLSDSFVIQVVGGPNRRTDYHINETEEFYYQLKGNMVLKVVSDDEFRDIPINQGEIFLLPGNVPHSPQRQAETVGLVIERRRDPNHIDTLRWYCDRCKKIVYQERFHCEGLDLGQMLKPFIEKYYASEKLRTCKSCGHINAVPK